jgi:TonB family protein
MKPKYRVVLSNSFAVMLLLLFSLSSAAAQEETPEILWEMLAPASEEFTVDLPGKPDVSNQKEPYGQITLTTTYYTLATSDGPFFMISSVSGMESFLSLISGTEGMTAAADGFRDNFLKELRAKNMKAEMTFDRDLKLNGHPGKQFNIVMGEISGIARLYATRKKIYAVLVLNAAQGDKRVERFINSFTLKAATVDVATDAKTIPFGVISGPVVTMPPGKTNADTNPPPPVAVPDSQAKTRQPIQGGVLNSKAISLPKPSYSEAAREAKASGTVTVQITIDENGDVISARAVSGHPSLQDAAVAAASRAKFSPTRLSGQPVKVKGVVIYNFALQ